MEKLSQLLDSLTNEVLITSTGMISRKVYNLKDRDRNFYMMGSMGMALPIGLGISYNRPDLKVIVVSGDGAALMSLGSMVLHNKLKPDNLAHYIIDNNCYASTGGQPTCSDAVIFTHLSPKTYVIYEKDTTTYPRIPLKPNQITERFRNAIIYK